MDNAHIQLNWNILYVYIYERFRARTATGFGCAVRHSGNTALGSVEDAGARPEAVSCPYAALSRRPCVHAHEACKQPSYGMFLHYQLEP